MQVADARSRLHESRTGCATPSPGLPHGKQRSTGQARDEPGPL